MMRKMLFTRISILCFAVGVSAERSTLVTTRLGDIKGIISPIAIDNSTSYVKAFKKIPYAKPPTGALRFEDPVPYGPWNGTLDGMRFGPSCYQQSYPAFDEFLPNTLQSEDCLFINIYAPADSSPINKKSVMIWIHGGGYVIGQGMFYNGTRLASVGDVIVVTLNYRLNAFGFFRTTDGQKNGNYGLNDQILAMRWVKDNIDSFGGDPESITIFGESAGGWSVSLHAINANNNGLFRRVIQQSGTANALGAVSTNPYEGSSKLLEKLKCDNGTITENVLCAKRQSAEKILKAAIEVYTRDPNSIEIQFESFWAPLFEESPRDILNNHTSSGNIFYKSLDVIIGNCASEGSTLLDVLYSMKDILPFNLSYGITADYFQQHIIAPFVLKNFGKDLSLRDKIFQVYNGNGSLSTQGKEVINFFGDFFFVFPAVQGLDSHAKSNKNHTTQFQYLNRRRSILSSPIKLHPWFIEAGHADEIPYLFPMTSVLPFNKEDNKFSHLMMKYWSNFAKSGDVNGDGLPHWPKYNLEVKKYIDLDHTQTIKDHLYKDRMDFWHSVMNGSLSPTPCSQPSCIFG